MSPLGDPGRYFRRHRSAVTLGWELVDSGQLRKAQLGAAWALSAHGTVSTGPGLVVLPTGVGKTLVLCLAPYLLRSRRVLVVTPGRLVRAQVTSAFETLKDLKSAGVLAPDTPSPAVVRVEHRATTADWGDWRNADVVIGTPDVLSHGYPGVERVPQGLFDLVIFDEAHHLPARVWTAILEAIDAPAVLLTATPTRRDGKPLAGDLVYAYPLSQAIADGVYAPVRFRAVTPADGQDPDRAIALAAHDRLADPMHREAGSRLLVRTGTKLEAERLVQVYATVGLDVGLVLGDTAPSTVRRILGDVTEGRLQGFVAVGAMIEGFDFPALKIAAYHHPHRSLAPTLQFLGRLSRVTPHGIRGELLAIPEQVEGETRELYNQDRDWAELMPEIVDAALHEEQAIRHYVANAHVAGPLDVPARAITPPKSARIYRMADDVLPTLDVEPKRIGRADVVFRLYDPGTSLVAFVTHRIVRQRWADTTLLDVPEFDLHLATWVDKQRVLFVSTESGPALDDLLRCFGVAGGVRNLAPDDLVRLISAADPGSYFSVGLRAAQARRAQGASYDMTAGPAVQSALDYNERNSTILGHVMARPKTGNRGTVGFSVAKSKLWEPDSAQSLLDFRHWAVARAADLDRPAASIGLPGLDVQLGEQFTAFTGEVLSAALDSRFLTGEYLLTLRGAVVDAGSVDVLADLEGDETLEITLIVDDDPVWRGWQATNGSVTALEHTDVQVLVAATAEVIEVPRALRDAPLGIFCTDGSTVVGEVRLPPRHVPAIILTELLLSDAWAGIDITTEIGPLGTVQARTAELAAIDASWVATDHTSYELADFISLAINNGTPSLRFFHCKGSGAAKPGRRVGDLYEVIGQVVKNVPRTLDPAWLWSELLRRLDERTAFKIVYGDESTFRARLQQLSQGHQPAEIEIIAVQPGVSISDLQGWPVGRALLHAADGWCTGENVQFRLLGSA
jgi:superfamily II DNA or RNA helicase